MSEEYVSRLESELAALKASVQTMGSPGDTAAPPRAPPRATETGERASLPTGPDKKGPARNAPPFGKATAVSKTTLDEDLAKAQAKYSDDRLAKFEKAMEEKRKKWDELFPKIDTSNDGKLSREEVTAYMQSGHHLLSKAGKAEAIKEVKAEMKAEMKAQIMLL